MSSLSLTFASSSLLLQHHNPSLPLPPKPFVLCCGGHFPSSSSSCFVAAGSSKSRVLTASATALELETEEEKQLKPRPTEVYVCNIPRSCDTEQLLEMFNPHGTVLSVQVSRNVETGQSRGTAYVTVDSISSAKKAILALDKSDVGGREMRVRFSAEMNPRRRNLETMNAAPKRTIYYEGPHKLYVGNLSKNTTLEDLRHLFGRFGNVASVRVLQDLRKGSRRVYAFVSYLSHKEWDAAKSLNGTEFGGRTLVVREGVQKENRDSDSS
ncbi:hypothetical protein RJT34_20506 [Clitoria ternatea]|uniref:RRM domain-containing protein n=1 Tax=Clitoria ternatea TaxID=43366 RepID=A0AAN9IT12_CLITE